MKVVYSSLLLAALAVWQPLPAAPFSGAPQEPAAKPLGESDISELKAKADAGDPSAENAMGILYRNGQWVNKDKQEAVRWYRRAAKHGNAAGMFNLGAA